MASISHHIILIERPEHLRMLEGRFAEGAYQMGCNKEFDPEDIIQSPEEAQALLQNYADQVNVQVNEEFVSDPHGLLDQFVNDPDVFLKDNPQLVEAQLGRVKDFYHSALVSGDSALEGFSHNPTKGPDYINEDRFPGAWFDLTTKQAMSAHERKYANNFGKGYLIDQNRNKSELWEAEALERMRKRGDNEDGV